MNKLIKKIKYNILYNRIEYPLLHIVNKEDYDFFIGDDIIFEQRDVVIREELILENKRYNSIILDDIKTIPLELFKLLDTNGTLYVFDDYNDLELSKYFKFVTLNEFKINLEIIPEDNNELIQFSKNDENRIKLIIASNNNSLKFSHITSLSIDYLNRYLKSNFIDMGLFLEKEQKLKIIQKKFSESINKEELLFQKQKIIKNAINDLLSKIEDNSIIIQKNKIELLNYQSKLKNFVLEMNTLYNKYDNINEINYLEQLINNNIDNIKLNIKLNKEILKNKSDEKRNSFLIKISDSSDNIDEIKKIYEENKELIEENNLHVSEISHLKFDIKEVVEEKYELISTIKELEKQLNELEANKDKYFNTILDKFNRKNANKIELIMEKNKKLKEEIEAQNNKIAIISEKYNKNILIINENNKKLNKETEAQKNIIRKLEFKNKENVSIIDEKSVLTQKLNLKLTEINKELMLKDKLINKKNLIIREKENFISLLEDKLRNNEILYENIKNKLKESNNKINSNYYKELYDNLENEYKKIKNKYNELKKINTEYKSEIEECEMKVEELTGYNEQITKDMDIDLDF